MLIWLHHAWWNRLVDNAGIAQTSGECIGEYQWFTDCLFVHLAETHPSSRTVILTIQFEIRIQFYLYFYFYYLKPVVVCYLFM